MSSRAVKVSYSGSQIVAVSGQEEAAVSNGKMPTLGKKSDSMEAVHGDASKVFSSSSSSGKEKSAKQVRGMTCKEYPQNGRYIA